MSNNIAVSITADVADLQVKRAIMSAELKAATKDLNTFAKEAASTGSTSALREGMLASAGAAEKAKASIAQMNVELAKTAAEARQAGHAAEEGGHGFIAMGHEIHEAAESVRTFQMRAKEFAEVYVAMFAVEKVVEFAKQMGEAAEKTKHTAEQFGMTVPEVQKLQGVATQTGISIDSLTRGFGIMDKNLVTAKGTTSATANAFKAMGVSIDDGRTQMQKFAAISDKFKEMEDGPKKAALAMLLFGKSGKELIPILNLGAEGIAEMNKRTEEYGGVSEDANAKGVALAESINESKLAFDGVNNVLTSALAPVLKTIVDSLNTVVLAFIKSYKEGGFVAIAFQAITTAVEEVGAVVNYLAGVFSALWDAVSDVVSAIVSDISDAFGVKTPDYFDTSKIALILFKDAFIILKDEAVIVINVIKGLLIGLIDVLALVGKIAWDAFNMNWGAIAADWQSGLNTLKSHALKTANEIKESYADLATTVSNALQGKGPAVKEGGIPELKEGTGDGPELGATHKAKKAPKGKDELVANLEAALTAKKLAWSKEQDAQGTAIAFSLQAESDYWNKILARTDLSAKDRAAIETKYLAVHSQIIKQRWADEEAAYKTSLDTADKNEQAKLELVKAHTAEVKRFFGEESTEYKRAQEEEVRAKRKADDEIEKIEQIHRARQDAFQVEQLAEAQRLAAFRVQMGVESNAQLLADERRSVDAKYRIELDQLAREKAIADADGNTGEQARIMARAGALRQAYQNQLTAIDRKATLERTQIERTAIASTASLWSQNIAKLVTLQQGFGATLKSLYTGMVSIVSSALASILEKWLREHIATLILGRAASSAAAVAQVTSAAGIAGANGVASFAAAPWPIDIGAPGFGASMAAAAAAFAPAASAAGGWWEVGQDTTTRIHAKEMVLPAWAASPLRNMLAGGGKPAANNNAPEAANDGAGGGLTVHIHAVDGESVKRLFANNGDALAGAMKMAHRKGKFKG
jgi:hypothetical protein